jgi:hypothetical protein
VLAYLPHVWSQDGATDAKGLLCKNEGQDGPQWLPAGGGGRKGDEENQQHQ